MKKLLLLLLLLPFSAYAAITYATFSTTDKAAGVTLSNSDKTASYSSNKWDGVNSTLKVSSGKWYWEVTIGDAGTNNAIRIGTGPAGGVSNTGSEEFGMVLSCQTGQFLWGFSGTGTDASRQCTDGDVLGFAMDEDGETVTVYKNGTQLNATPIAYPAQMQGVDNGIRIMFADNSSAQNVTINTGQSAFVYSVPSGYNSGFYSGTADPLATFQLWSLSLF